MTIGKTHKTNLPPDEYTAESLFNRLNPHAHPLIGQTEYVQRQYEHAAEELSGAHPQIDTERPGTSEVTEWTSRDNTGIGFGQLFDDLNRARRLGLPRDSRVLAKVTSAGAITKLVVRRRDA
ncbi:hypothetical protein SEA_SKOG_43 [Gordonia phage Skog]|uniref:Uncharacterized protein n=1 Tax=Gordonia phage Skog TaxID=2704033 RepID=A0A6G6XK19_9CAUD|nr:hypothetical protein KHQ85_gp043 [Gordonia phage Skog]QIG58195.1 hypothetical protein SEA_SKOG_43 [Gordonia phage Skog]